LVDVWLMFGAVQGELCMGRGLELDGHWVRHSAPHTFTLFSVSGILLVTH
jgi:hypothetical protein